MFQVVAVFLT